MDFNNESHSDSELILIDDILFESIIEEKELMEDYNKKRKRSPVHEDSDDACEIVFSEIKTNNSKNKKKDNIILGPGKKNGKSLGLVTDFFTPVKKSSFMPAKGDGSNIITDSATTSKKHCRAIAGSKDQEIKAEAETDTSFNSQLHSHHPELKKEVSDVDKSGAECDLEPQTTENTSPKTKYDSSYYYYLMLKMIVNEELINQMKLESETEKQGRKFEKLFSPGEHDYFDKLYTLPKDARFLFSRMLCRKNDWHRVSEIKYEGITGNIEEVFMELNKHGFIDVNIWKEKLEFLLKMLKKAEVVSLWKKFARSTVKNDKNKDYVIAAILNSCKTQPSVGEMWNKRKSSREDLIKKEALKLLGTCAILNSSALDAFNNLLILFAMTHSPVDEIQWSSEIHMMTKVYFKQISYPRFEVNPTVIFEARNDFVSYVKAIKLMLEYNNESSVEKKTEIAEEVMKLFRELLADEKFIERFSKLPSFLKRYSSGSVCSRILTQYCEQDKKKKTAEGIIDILKVLIDQDAFSVQKKGNWYNDLIKCYESIGETDQAVAVLAKALGDEYISEVQKLSLQRRGMAILKKKKYKHKNLSIAGALNSLCHVAEPEIVEIKAKAVEGNEPGRKCVYVEESANGRLYSSVEERAISYYKENGFTEGVHAEGSIVVTIYVLLFFDIIYGPGPPGAFQNSFQREPLDFYSRSFYLSRKDAVDSRLEKIKDWSMDEFKEEIEKVYNHNYGVACHINWRDDFDVELFCDVVKCLGLKELSHICRRLVSCFKVYKSGFPDLTLWNAETLKLKFVEVKSPNDTLRENQQIWLDFLRQHNIPCEVCCVRNVASKAMKNV